MPVGLQMTSTEARLVEHGPGAQERRPAGDPDWDRRTLFPYPGLTYH